MNRLAFVLAIAAAPIFQAGDLRAEVFETGGYSFSDELGGFRLLSATGTGSLTDPFVIVEELHHMDAAVLVVRKIEPDQQHLPGYSEKSFLSLSVVKTTVNLSHRVWRAFDIELREELREPSGYGDGLSFDQLKSVGRPFSASVFDTVQEYSEPMDLLRYFSGHVDPGGQVSFQFHITDPTPTPIFFLIQQPKFLIAESRPQRFAAAGNVACRPRMSSVAEAGSDLFSRLIAPQERQNTQNNSCLENDMQYNSYYR